MIIQRGKENPFLFSFIFAPRDETPHFVSLGIRGLSLSALSKILLRKPITVLFFSHTQTFFSSSVINLDYIFGDTEERKFLVFDTLKSEHSFGLPGIDGQNG